MNLGPLRTAPNSTLKLATVASLIILGGCAVTKAGPNAGATAGPDVEASSPSTLSHEHAAAAKPTVGQEVAAVADNQVVILFDTGSAAVSPAAGRKMDLAVRLFRDANPVLMFSTGYSDHSGDEYKNLLLSGRRAEAVKRAMVERGIPADRMLIRAMGESGLVSDEKPDSPANRRVTITWRLL